MRFRAKLESDVGPHCGAVVPPMVMTALAGERVRIPVRVTINDRTFRTTTFRMGDEHVRIGLNKEIVAAAVVRAGQNVVIDIEVDDEPRTVEPPPGLARALSRNKTARAAWNDLSYTRQREYAQSIESAKKAETRARRIAKCVEDLRAR
jgi:hypothetical protein